MDAIKVLLVVGVALGVTATAVYQGDTATVVPPPEAVAEQFARLVAARRYDLALHHVDPASGITLITVQLAGEALHDHAGGIDQVEGQSGSMHDGRASATAVLTTGRAGRIRYACRFVRREGIWKIVDWEKIANDR